METALNCNCISRIPYPLGIENGLVKMTSLCIVERMMQIGVTQEGLRDYLAKVPNPNCPIVNQIEKYLITAAGPQEANCNAPGNNSL